MFETNIRVLGGLLSAYHLSGSKQLLTKATALGERLLLAFNTSTGLPWSHINFEKRDVYTDNARYQDQLGSPCGNCAYLSEVGTLILEFRYLSHVSENPTFAKAVEKIYKSLNAQSRVNGLWPVVVDLRTGRGLSGKLSFGGFGDSFYEYLLKAWIQGGKKDTLLWQWYADAVDGLSNVLIRRTSSGKTYLPDYPSMDHMQHLACFTPGMLALGVHSNPDYDPQKASRDMNLAKQLLETCVEMYTTTASGLAPDTVKIEQDHIHAADNRYMLRPETVESLFILHQITKDNHYREQAWTIFNAIQQRCKVRRGYGAYRDVLAEQHSPEHVEDVMESFFVAETLK